MAYRRKDPKDWTSLCRFTGKRGYPDQKSAQIALVEAVISLNSGFKKRKERRVYQCERCQQWHLTSQPARAAGEDCA